MSEPNTEVKHDNAINSPSKDTVQDNLKSEILDSSSDRPKRHTPYARPHGFKKGSVEYPNLMPGILGERPDKLAGYGLLGQCPPLDVLGKPGLLGKRPDGYGCSNVETGFPMPFTVQEDVQNIIGLDNFHGNELYSCDQMCEGQKFFSLRHKNIKHENNAPGVFGPVPPRPIALGIFSNDGRVGDKMAIKRTLNSAAGMVSGDKVPPRDGLLGPCPAGVEGRINNFSFNHCSLLGEPSFSHSNMLGNRQHGSSNFDEVIHNPMVNERLDDGRFQCRPFGGLSGQAHFVGNLPAVGDGLLGECPSSFRPGLMGEMPSRSRMNIQDAEFTYINSLPISNMKSKFSNTKTFSSGNCMVENELYDQRMMNVGHVNNERHALQHGLLGESPMNCGVNERDTFSAKAKFIGSFSTYDVASKHGCSGLTNVAVGQNARQHDNEFNDTGLLGDFPAQHGAKGHKLDFCEGLLGELPPGRGMNKVAGNKYQDGLLGSVPSGQKQVKKFSHDGLLGDIPSNHCGLIHDGDFFEDTPIGCAPRDHGVMMQNKKWRHVGKMRDGLKGQNLANVDKNFHLGEGNSVHHGQMRPNMALRQNFTYDAVSSKHGATRSGSLSQGSMLKDDHFSYNTLKKDGNSDHSSLMGCVPSGKGTTPVKCFSRSGMMGIDSSCFRVADSSFPPTDSFANRPGLMGEVPSKRNHITNESYSGLRGKVYNKAQVENRNNKFSLMQGAQLGEEFSTSRTSFPRTHLPDHAFNDSIINQGGFAGDAGMTNIQSCSGITRKAGSFRQHGTRSDNAAFSTLGDSACNVRSQAGAFKKDHMNDRSANYGVPPPEMFPNNNNNNIRFPEQGFQQMHCNPSKPYNSKDGYAGGRATGPTMLNKPTAGQENLGAWNTNLPGQFNESGSMEGAAFFNNANPRLCMGREAGYQAAVGNNYVHGSSGFVSNPAVIHRNPGIDEIGVSLNRDCSTFPGDYGHSGGYCDAQPFGAVASSSECFVGNDGNCPLPQVSSSQAFNESYSSGNVNFPQCPVPYQSDNNYDGYVSSFGDGRFF